MLTQRGVSLTSVLHQPYHPGRTLVSASSLKGRWDPDGDVQDSIFDGHKLGQMVLPLALARQRADCGAPPELYERGVPQYPPDEDDTPDTHPLA